MTRSDLTSALAACDATRAAQAARTILQDHSRMREWSFIQNELRKTQPRPTGLKLLNVALLSSFSTEFLHAPLTAYGLANGFDIAIYQAGFAQFRQDILDPQSGLYAFSPDVIILAVEGKDWIPELYSNYADVVESGIETVMEQWRREVETLIDALRSRTDASLLVHNFALPPYPEFGILDWRLDQGQTRTVIAANDWLADKCRASEGAYVVDYFGLVSRFGARRWYDHRMSHIAQAPIAMDMLQHLTCEHMKFFRAFAGCSKKCLVLDLDNTLWGGVVGESGIEGIDLGPTYPGSMFVAFQKTILQLQKRGILLAVASKNNPEDAEKVFAEHPHMLLRKRDFACLEVHWGPKSGSIQAIAERLNIGLDHIVFVDDNPAECAEVSNALPMVYTICLPPQPERFSEALLEEGLFDALTYSAEDRSRTRLYQRREAAEALRAQAGSLEDFYRSLQMSVVIAPLRQSTLSRAAQLTQKTNQFNATTRRYTEAQLSERMLDTTWKIATVSVKDRFGDSGVVGVMMAMKNGRTLEIDNFLLSCRVIGRSIESAMLAHLCKLASEDGLNEVRGYIVPTPKNAPVRDLFEKHGFECVERMDGAAQNDAAANAWILPISVRPVQEPEWMAVAVDA